MARLRRWSLLASLILLIPFLATVSGADTPITPAEGASRGLFNLVLVFALAIGIFVNILLVAVVLKFRKRKRHVQGVPNPRTHNASLEAAWTIIPAVILLVVGIATFQTLAVTDTIPEHADVTVYVIGHQWYWEFRVLDANGTWTNTTSEFTVKIGETVKLIVESVDVAHSLYIPDFFSFKIDALPGQENVNWFQPLKVGDFEIRCAEFCGVSHYAMEGVLHVVPA